MAKTSVYKTDEGKKRIISYYETLLLQWNHSSGQLLLDTNLGETFIIESGKKNAPAIILLHGSCSNSAMWTADVIELSESYHVFAIDIIGECGKSSENRPTFKNDDYARWILELIKKLGLNRTSIIACSLGGWIALSFAIKYPQKTEKLILLAPAGITQVKLRTIFRIIVTSVTGRWGFSKLNSIVYGDIEIDNQALEFASLVNKYYIPRTDALPIFPNKLLQKIEVPTFFIGGEDDCFYNSKKIALRLKKNLDNIQCVILKNRGHVLINQTKTIIHFLNDRNDGK